MSAGPAAPDRSGAASVRIVYVVRSFPRLSQTFVLNELVALEGHGADVEVLSIVRADERRTHAQLASLRARVRYLSDERRSAKRRLTAHIAVAVRRPVRYVSTLVASLVRRTRTSGYHTVSSIGSFDLAVLAAVLLGVHRRDVARSTRLHAHFAHDPTLLAMLVHDLCGVPFSFTGHARDLTQIERAALSERVAKAAQVVTICSMNADLLRSLDPDEPSDKVHVVFNGVDLESFRGDSAHRGGAVVRMCSIGRLVDKKGFEVLLAAVGHLARRGVAVELDVFGSGPLHDRLRDQIDEEEIGGTVRLLGERTQQELQEVLPGYDVFVLTPYVTEDGDRDGLPTVLVEAMACSLPVVSTDVAGVPDLVRHGVNGLLCPPRDPVSVADALERLAGDADLRASLGAEARRTVERDFDLRRNTGRLAALLTSGR